VVCKLWTYIKANELQDPTDKRKILLDAAMAEVFGVQELTMFSLNKELTSHLSNIPVPVPVQQEGGMDGGSVGDLGSVGGRNGNGDKDMDGDRDGVDQRDMYDEEDDDDDAGDDRDEDDHEDDNENENEDEVVYDGEFYGGDEGGRETESAVQSDVASPGVHSSLPLAL
jgi:SWIB/MDM2 domain